MPNTLRRVMDATATAVKAFKEAYITSDPLAVPGKNDFCDYGARKMRYAMLWSFFENSAYRDVHSWATRMRADYGLYRFTRSVMGPAFDIGSFWHTYLFGGLLDPLAGDGGSSPSAIPIITKNESIRTPIAQIWKDSSWQVNKDTMALWGAVMGDVALQIIDDPEKQKIYLKIIHPSTVKFISRDLLGNIQSYIFEETRIDPEDTTWISNGDPTSARTCTYSESAEKDPDGDTVKFTTYRNGQPYKWNGKSDTWSMQYGFVPLVVVQHLNVGLDWGWSEFHAGLSKFREVDDICSKISDQIRKTVDSPWLFSGVSKPSVAPNMTGSAATTSRIEPRRDEIPTLYGPVGAEAKALVADMNLADVVMYIDKLLGAIEKDYPEIRIDTWRMTGDTSGNALRVNRQPTEVKVQMRRPSYDDGVRKALQMGIIMGAMGNYPGYEGFSQDSLEKGNLEFSVGRRPVFSPDILDIISEKKQFWEAAQVATTAGMPLQLYLKDIGWAQAKIDEVIKLKEEQLEKQQEQFNQANAAQPDGNKKFENLPLGKNTGISDRNKANKALSSAKSTPSASPAESDEEQEE